MNFMSIINCHYILLVLPFLGLHTMSFRLCIEGGGGSVKSLTSFSTVAAGVK